MITSVPQVWKEQRHRWSRAHVAVAGVALTVVAGGVLAVPFGASAAGGGSGSATSTVSAAVPATSAITVPPVRRHRCAAATKRCDGSIKVRLDRADVRSRLIDVGFAWIPRTDQRRPAAGTIFVNPGGPTQAIADIDDYLSALRPLLARHNLLVIDPRGFGRSTPQSCPKLNTDSDASIAACAARLGPFASHLTAAEVADDLEQVRQALGIARMKLYGNSYGTVYVPAYATRYPQHTEALYLDSVVGTGADGYAAERTQVLQNMLDPVCRVSRACRQVTPDARALLDRVVGKIRAKRLPGLTASTALVAVNSISEPVGAREVIAALVAADAGDPAPLARLGRDPDADGGAQAPAPDFAATLAYRCSEWRDGFDRDASPAQRRAQLAALRARTKPLAPFDYSDIPVAHRRDYPDWCTNWPTPRETPVIAAGARYPDVPVLVVNGQLDTATPPQSAATVAARFPRARLVVVPFGGHASGFGDDRGTYRNCVRDLMRRFLSTLRHDAAKTPCSAEILRPLGTFPRTTADLPPAAAPKLNTTARRLLTAAHATANDALARANPINPVPPGKQPGLRGGTIDYRTDGAIRLAGVKFVADASVNGTITMDQHRPTARLTVKHRGTRHRIHLTWQALRAENTTTITGTFDQRRIRARVGLT